MIKSVRISNLGPFYGTHEVALTDGILSVEGRYSDKPGESNRAGKSSFFDALRFALYGQHRHRTLSKYINRKADAARDPVGVSVWLETPQGDLHISRDYDPMAGKFVLQSPELELTNFKSADAQIALENVLGCDYQNATRTWMVLQEDSKGIMNMPLADRKRFLLDLFSPVSYPWPAYHTEAASRHAVMSVRRQELSNRIEMLNQAYESARSRNISGEIKSVRAAIAEKQTKLAHLLADMKTLQAKMDPELIASEAQKVVRDEQTVKELYIKLQQTRRDLDRLERNMNTMNTKQAELGKYSAKLASLQEKAKKLKIDETNVAYEKVYNKLAASSPELARMIEESNRIEKFKGVCPVTGKECSSGADISKYRSELDKRITTASRKNEDLQAEQSRLQRLLDASDTLVSDIRVMENNISATERSLELLDQADEIYEEAKERMEHDEKFYANMKQLVEKKRVELEARKTHDDLMYKNRILQYQQQERDTKLDLQKMQDSMARLMSEESALKTIQMDLANAKRELGEVIDRESALRALKPMLSSDGVPFMHILSSISEFETSINSALADLGTDLRVDVEPYSIMTTLSPTCQVCGFEYPKSSAAKFCLNSLCKSPREYKKKETLEIRLKGSMFDVDYDEDSGGGQQWVSMGIRFALFNILRERGLLQSIDFFMLDEILAPLSEVGRAAMLSFLESVCETYGISQMFFVTHTDISSVLPPAVIVERNESLQESRLIQ